MELDPKNPLLHGLLGDIHLAQGDTLGALMDYEDFLALAPNNPDFHEKTAYIYYSLGQTDKALSECEKAIKLNEKDADYHYLKSIILSKWKERQEKNKKSKKLLNAIFV
jgi:tetratricopeptide (TPR) repeat protein